MLGSGTSLVFEAVSVVMLMIQMTLLTKSGFSNASETTIENINQAFIRVSIF